MEFPECWVLRTFLASAGPCLECRRLRRETEERIRQWAEDAARRHRVQVLVEQRLAFALKRPDPRDAFRITNV